MRYAISGQERRTKKKELSQLKSLIRNFWHYEDIDRVYGGGLEDQICDQIIKDTEEKIRIIELELSEPHISVVREEKINLILN
mgnify:CR=1 FL=1|jgi:hypothetical protein